MTDYKDNMEEKKEIIEIESIPHFFPTFRVKRNYYPLPIIITVISAAILSYLAILVGYEETAEYIPESEYGPIAGILNGIIFTAMAVGSAFIIIYFVKR